MINEPTVRNLDRTSQALTTTPNSYPSDYPLASVSNNTANYDFRETRCATLRTTHYTTVEGGGTRWLEKGQARHRGCGASFSLRGLWALSWFDSTLEGSQKTFFFLSTKYSLMCVAETRLLGLPGLHYDSRTPTLSASCTLTRHTYTTY